MIGPEIPPEILAKKREQEEEVEQQQEQQDEDDPDAYAPALPPDLLEARQRQRSQQQESARPRRRAPVGPSLPDRQDDTDDEDDVIGPTLPKDYDPAKASIESTIADIEARAQKSKEAMDAAKEDASKKKVERPEWMLVPPEVDYLRHADSSRSRTFSTRGLTEAERDRSVWTDTPADRERKAKRKREEEEEEEKQDIRPPPRQRQEEYEVRRSLESYNAMERPKSLMEIHKEMKKKRREPVEDVASRPFDREKDLIAPRPMNRKQKNELLKQSRELGGRFGHGQGSSFL